MPPRSCLYNLFPYNGFSNELENIKNYLRPNGYPLNLVKNSILYKFNSVFIPIPEIITVTKALIYLRIP